MSHDAAIFVGLICIGDHAAAVMGEQEKKVS